MNPDEHVRLIKICTQISKEKDPRTFDNLVKELNDLLGRKHEHIRTDHKPN